MEEVLTLSKQLLLIIKGKAPIQQVTIDEKTYISISHKMLKY